MATPRKSTPRRTPAKSTSERGAAKSTAKRTTPAKRTTQARAAQNGQADAPKKSLRTIALSAARELSQLIGQMPEGIVGVDKQDDGWRVLVEVVESHRIPETTDIMAVYEVDVDNDGAVTGYRRRDRYVRGRIQE
jgi:hypothetical protein